MNFLVSMLILSLSAGADPRPVAPTNPASSADTIDGSFLMTTWVYEGARGMVGINGYYTLTISPVKDQLLVELVKTGYTGTTYSKKKILRGSTRLSGSVPEASEPHLELAITLRNEVGDEQPMQLSLWKVGDEVHGTWEYTSKRHTRLVEVIDGEEIRVAKVYGALIARRGLKGPRIEITSATKVACPVCCDLELRCGVSGPRGCNSSMSCHSGCEMNEETGELYETPPLRACLVR